MVRDEIEQHADPARVRLRDESIEVLERAEVGMNPRVVGDVVAPVDVRRRVDRVEPDRVDAEPLEVVEALGHAREVADPVAVRVGERARVDLVQHCVAPPAVTHGARTLIARSAVGCAPCSRR